MNKKIPASIAIVDDHILTRKTLSCRFASLGYNVVMEAGNGKELTDKMKTHPAPDICLLDINRPAMSGIETAIQMKKEWPHVKIVFFSTHNSDSYTARLKEIGVDGVISKKQPFAKLNDTLMNIIQ